MAKFFNFCNKLIKTDVCLLLHHMTCAEIQLRILEQLLEEDVSQAAYVLMVVCERRPFLRSHLLLQPGTTQKCTIISCSQATLNNVHVPHIGYFIYTNLNNECVPTSSSSPAAM